MRHPITGRRISREKYEAQQVLFAKRYAEMKAEEQSKASSKNGKSGHALTCSPDSIDRVTIQTGEYHD